MDRKKTGGGLRLDVPLEWLDGYVAARSGKEDLPFQLWQQGEQWTSSLPIRLHDACAAAPMSRLTERWQMVREKLSRQKLSQPCRSFRQQGDKVWWDGVVTEENDMFVNVSLPAQGMYVRGKRRMFDERTCPGMAVQVRIGRVHPLYNEIQILEAVSMDG